MSEERQTNKSKVTKRSMRALESKFREDAILALLEEGEIILPTLRMIVKRVEQIEIHLRDMKAEVAANLKDIQELLRERDPLL